jgi:hypothetical protein
LRRTSLVITSLTGLFVSLNTTSNLQHAAQASLKHLGGCEETDDQAAWHHHHHRAAVPLAQGTGSARNLSYFLKSFTTKILSLCCLYI